MSTILEALAGIWPYLLAAAGVVFGIFRHQQAKSKEAQAGQKVAEAQTRTAAVEKSEAEANATAARAGAEAVKERTDVENEIASLPAGDAARRLRDEWSRD